MWNYRILMKRDRSGATYFALHEVYYDDRGKPYAWSSEPEVTGETKAELISSLAMMLRDATKMNVPILDERKMPGYKPEKKARRRK